MKSLMLENYDVKDYDEGTYPFYKFFLMTTYPSKDTFINELKKVPQYEIKYPLLKAYTSNDIGKINILKDLPYFNEFVNYMINYYSYNITREEASRIKLKEEDIYINDEKFQEKFKKFKEIWINIMPHSKKYECHEMRPILLDEDKTLAHFLNDKGEICKGMYIAAAYNYFIELQNHFLNQLIEPLKHNNILHHFYDNLEKSIDIQSAKKYETLNFDKANGEFMETIYENCKRNIFNEDNSINYMNYKQIIYDFDSMEKIMGEFILPGKVRFNDSEQLTFVTYCYEGFSGTKSSIITEFSSMYKQIPLSKENKQRIYDSIKEKLESNIEYLSKVLFSIQFLFYYLTQENKGENDDIKTIVQDLPDYVRISNECIEFFEKQKIKLNELEGLYSYVELLCFKLIIKNLRNIYMKKIDGKKAEKILQLFEQKAIESFSKMDLATACRKMISRYLVSTRDDTEYNEDNLLSSYINRADLWEKEEEDIKEDLKKLGAFNLTVGQCYELYNLLGGDESKTLENIIVKKEEEEKDNYGEDRESEEKINTKPKRVRRKF